MADEGRPVDESLLHVPLRVGIGGVKCTGGVLGSLLHECIVPVWVCKRCIKEPLGLVRRHVREVGEGQGVRLPSG